jgi:hypothetical protein
MRVMHRNERQARAAEDPLEEEDFMAGRDHARVGQGGQGFAMGPGDPLWEEYKIRPTWSQRRKVEVLFTEHRMNEEEIGRLLNLSDIEVQSEIAQIETEWTTKGQPLDAEGKERERGRMISIYERLLADIEAEVGNNPDPRMLALKQSTIKSIIDLRGLMQDKKDVGKEKEEDQWITKVNALSSESLLALSEILGTPTTPILQ